MASNKQLGLYWGNNTLYFTEIISGKLTKSFSVPLDFHKTTPADDNKFISSSMQLVSTIEDQLKTHKITTTTTNLSLPTKDIIFRSFIIPWMSANEIRGVVTFEISKYIPFSLEELWYSFHPITITVNNVKKLRIIFVAVRKDTLENYTNILESAGLQISVIEPCSQSIIRTLIYQKLISKESTTAIVEKGELAGKITIIDQSVPQFVREFQLKMPARENANENTELIARLVNEIRISIDYFTRQENLNPVSEIKILIGNPSEDLAQNLTTDLGITTTPVLLQDILPIPEINNIAFLNAFGVGIHNTVNLTSNFDLSKKDNKKIKHISGGSSKIASYSSIISTLLICVGAVFLTFLTTQGLIDKPQKNVSRLETELGTYKETLIEKIENVTQTTETSLKHLKSINAKSNVAFYLTNFPLLLPEGVWIKTLDVQYPEDKNLIKETKADENTSTSKPVVSLTGYAYSENIREQFKLVNQLLKNIRENKKLSAIFTQVTLETVKAEKVDELTVTYYQIVCR